MAFGMQIYNDDNTVAYNSVSPGGVFVQYIIMSPGTSDTLNYVYFPLDWASSPGGSTTRAGKRLVIVPMLVGSHRWSISAGFFEANQPPYVSWYNSAIPSGITRTQTILMVFAQ